MHIYFCKYRRRDNPNRVYHTTVLARSAGEARAFLAIKDDQFGSTVSSPRRGRAVVAEQDDGLTQAKAREWVQEHPGYTLVADEAPE
jgi:hypothetical protein